MMEMVREWVTSIVVITLLLSIVQTLIPQGTMQKIASFTSGLVLLIALLQPIVHLEPEKLQVDFKDYRSAVTHRQEELERQYAATLSKIIEDQTAAYILDKAAELGQKVTVQVTAELDENGLPVPGAVEISGSPLETLAAYMELELGIARERQVWTDAEN